MFTKKLAKKQLLSFKPTIHHAYRLPVDSEKTKELQEKLDHDINDITTSLINNKDIQTKYAKYVFIDRQSKEFRKDLYPDILEATIFFVNNKDIQTKCAGLSLLNCHIDRDSLDVEKPDCAQGPFKFEQLQFKINMALNVAAKEILNPNAKVQIKTLKLLHTLVNVDAKDSTFEIAAPAAETAFTNKNRSVRKEVLHLVDIFIYKGKALDTAKKIVSIAMMSKNKKEKRTGIELSRRIARYYDPIDETRS
jgi:hypothetical protein